MPVSSEIVEKAREILEDERQALREDVPLRDILLRVLEDVVQTGGAESLQKAEKVLGKMLDGEAVLLSEITDDLLLASDLLAAMQQVEASRRRIVRQWVRLVVQEVLSLLRTLV